MLYYNIYIVYRDFITTLIIIIKCSRPLHKVIVSTLPLVEFMFRCVSYASSSGRIFKMDFAPFSCIKFY